MSNSVWANFVTALGGSLVCAELSKFMANAKAGNTDCAIIDTMSGHAPSLHEVTSLLEAAVPSD